mmetsp:Transcript_51512/g.77057  ORF Transcript_51512/g.77057 Transcript_51512/m.77057 type:complete len:123 (-) Transcript_51512:11-379(-)
MTIMLHTDAVIIERPKLICKSLAESRPYPKDDEMVLEEEEEEENGDDFVTLSFSFLMLCSSSHFVVVVVVVVYYVVVVNVLLLGGCCNSYMIHARLNDDISPDFLVPWTTTHTSDIRFYSSK